MAFRAQPYRLEGDMTPEKMERVDEMFQILFDDVRNGNLTVSITQIVGPPGPAGPSGPTPSAFNEGDILYADDTDSLTTLGIGTAQQVLQVNAAEDAPEWGLVDFNNMEPAASASTLIGRRSGSAGDWEAVTVGSGLTMSAGAVLTAAGGGGWIPAVDGSEPPVFITDGAGVLILVAGP